MLRSLSLPMTRASQASPERPAAAPERGTLSLGERVRGDFPILDQEVNGQPLVYLDSGATSQKPTQVRAACGSSDTLCCCSHWAAAMLSMCLRFASILPAIFAAHEGAQFVTSRTGVRVGHAGDG